jgi:alpha-tubulin suppressor-like RCC1 family protein
MSGAAYCWGHNGFGQLGDGTTTPRAAPVAVGGGLSFRTVDAGTFHTCGVSTSGAAYCWGNNFFGMLGDGTTINRPAPTPVAGGLSFASVSSGESYACGVTTGGAAYCWGFNRWGQLGTGNTANATSGPVPVEGGLSFTTISAAGDHTCGVTTGGAGYCWGANTFGQLGYGTSAGLQQCFDPSRFSVPCTTVPVAVAGGLSFAAVTTASSETTCAVAASGAAYCWGNNAGGALGVGTSTGPEQCTIPPRGVRSACSTVPVAVAGGLSLTSVSSAGFASSNSSGGLTYTCGVTPSGAAYCWGLGTSTPTPVTPLGSGSAGIAAK